MDSQEDYYSLLTNCLLNLAAVLIFVSTVSITIFSLFSSSFPFSIPSSHLPPTHT